MKFMIKHSRKIFEFMAWVNMCVFFMGIHNLIKCKSILEAVGIGGISLLNLWVFIGNFNDGFLKRYFTNAYHLFKHQWNNEKWCDELPKRREKELQEEIERFTR